MMTSFYDVIRHFAGFGRKNADNVEKGADVSKNECQ